MEPNSPRHYWIIECHNGSPFRLHHIINPGYGEKGWYRHISSVESFRRHEEKRSGIHNGKEKMHAFEFWVFADREYSYYSQVGRESEFNPFVGLEFIESGSIFEFYNSIAYDHKARRYMSMK